MTNKKHSANSNTLLKAPRKRSKWFIAPFIALFALFGVVIILRSFASTAEYDPNDVLHGGFSTASTKAAQDGVILKLMAKKDNPGAKELFAELGVTDTEIRASKLVPGFNPHKSSYDNWYSFGRVNYGKPGTQKFTAGGVDFYAKPVKEAWADAATMTQPVLKGKTKDGRDFLIHAECGNLVVPSLRRFQANPNATIVKKAVSPANNAVVKPGDTVSYQLIAKSTGNTNAYVVVADIIPAGTTYVSSTVDTGNALPLANAKHTDGRPIYRWANYGLAPGSEIRITLKVKVDAGTKDTFCNIGYVTWIEGQKIPGVSHPTGKGICHPISAQGSPVLSVVKSANVPEGSQVKTGDVITYNVVGSNTGKANSTDAAIWDGIQDNGWYEFVEMGPLKRGNTVVPDAEIAEKAVGKPSNGWKYWGYTVKTLKPNEVVGFTIKFKIKQAQNPELKVCNLAIIVDKRPAPYGVHGADQVCHTTEGVEKSKSAIFLNRKGSDGKPLPADGKNVAKAGDEIQYTLKTKNLGAGKLKDYDIVEDLNDVLEYADVTDNGGGTLASGILKWKANIDPGKTDIRMFKIKVKSPIPNLVPKASSPGSYDYKMINIYGNTVEIPVDKPITQTIIDTLPQTGALGFLMIPLVLATLMLLAYTSGVFGHGRAKSTSSNTQTAGQPSSVHQPGDQFHPEEKATKDARTNHPKA
jgi:uncharacterized repeat protein (TIGR01451 family)